MFIKKPTGKNGVNGNGSRNGHKSNDGSESGLRLPVWGKSESVLGSGIYYQGVIKGNGNIRIEGTVDGEIKVQGTVTIAAGARVTANIEAEAVVVAGNLKGNITASRVDLSATGRVWGDVVTTSFATAEGAFLRGAVQMEERVARPSITWPVPEREPVVREQ